MQIFFWQDLGKYWVHSTILVNKVTQLKANSKKQSYKMETFRDYRWQQTYQVNPLFVLKTI